MSANVEPFRRETLAASECASLTRFGHPPGAKLPTSFSAHEAAEESRINIVESGCFRLKYGRHEWTLGAGSIFLSRPGEEYRYSHVAHAEPDTCTVLGFSDARLPRLIEILRPLPLVLPATNRLGFLHLQLSQTSHDQQESLDAIACEFVDAAALSAGGCDHLYRASQLKWYAERVTAARESIESDPAANHSLRDLAGRVSMSPFRFARVFRELTGVPPHKYVVQRRLQRAHDLLQSGESVTDTCYAVGFNNLSHFIRSFRRAFGVAPSRLN